MSHAEENAANIAAATESPPTPTPERTANDTPLARVVEFYATFSPESVGRFGEFYSDNAYFKDPFNEVRGIPAIQRVFLHMFEQIAEPRFVIVDQVTDAGGAVLIWEFHYRMKAWKAGGTQLMRGVSHLKFDADGRVNWHRDYWDAAEELYAKLPGIGCIFRGLQKRLSA
ncbi:nuclear transport factor 2 family protein [Rhodocyclus gracilis]|uniref:nuclear transport factor 2 family protein n=1 Tax=Rhodocyclus gracilis TaxID=2929842 RepID=UPI0030F3D3FF